MGDPPDGTQHPPPPGYCPELVDSSDQPPPDYHPEQLLAPDVEQTPPPTYTPSDRHDYPADPQPWILSSPDSFPADYNKPIWAYHNRQSNGIGIFQILIGIACVVFQVLSLGLSRASGVSVIGHGIWSGSMFVLTGVFGIVAGKKRTARAIKAFLVMCMVSAALTATLLSLGVFGAKKAGDLYKLFRCDYYFSIIYYNYEEYDNSNHSPCSSFIVAGVLGMVAAGRQTKCSIISFMVLCIMSASFTITLFSLAIIGAIIASSRYPAEFAGCDYSYLSAYNSYLYGHPTAPPCHQKDATIAMESLMVCMAFIEAIIAIWGSAICCKAVCCCAPSGCTQVMFIPQYCCATQPGLPVDSQQAPFQQVPCYVWPTPADQNLQFLANVNQIAPQNPNTAMTWTPPPYITNIPAPSYEQPPPPETKRGSLC